ncbi:hypothetical protein K439DRAFT_1409416 [Ramaria rubella]|nr:hypothetical protein K439DRAFT_1409416 [Ramaria rubella]
MTGTHRTRTLRRSLVFAVLSTAVTTPASAQDSETLDCNAALSVQGVSYDLKALNSVRTVKRIRETPPTKVEDELRFNICQDLSPRPETPDVDQCPSGTRACLTETNQKAELSDRIVTVIPVAQTSTLKPSYSTAQSPSGLLIQLHGPSFPPNSSPVPQSLNLTLLCTQSAGSDPTFVGYENGVVSVTWTTSAGCPAQPKDDNSDENDGGKTIEGGHSAGGSGIGWFFLLLFVSFLGYFAIGAYYNYNHFGATGWDLVPHRDFWHDVPYLLRDFTNHLCNTLRPGRGGGGSRRGYMAV